MLDLLPATADSTEVARDARGTLAVLGPVPMPFSEQRTYFLYRIDPTTGLYAGVLTKVRVPNDAQAATVALDAIHGWLATQWVRTLKRASARQVAA